MIFSEELCFTPSPDDSDSEMTDHVSPVQQPADSSSYSVYCAHFVSELKPERIHSKMNLYILQEIDLIKSTDLSMQRDA